MVCLLLLAAVAARALGASGALDTSFSGDGKRTTPFSNTTAEDEASGVAIQPDGRIVVAGETFQGSGEDFAVARYRLNGTLDASFSGNGKTVTLFGSDAEGSGVAIQGDGRIVVVGGGSGGNFAIARYRANGSLDPSFSGDGKRLDPLGAGSGEGAHAVAVQEDGKIVVAGSAEPAGTGIDFAIARYRTNGTLDTSFSGDGRRYTSFSNTTFDDQAEGVAIQPDGKIVVAGTSSQAALNDHFAVARYRPNGTLDPTFSGDGKRLTSFDNAGEENFAHNLAIRDGKIVVVGYSDQAIGSGFDQDFAIARYRANGTPDPNFSGDGKRLTEFDNGGQSDEANGVAIQADGMIVVAGGSTQTATSSDFALARYRANGSLDPTFSVDGKRLLPFDNTAQADEADAVAIQSNGRIVAVGTSVQPATGYDFAIARFLGS